MAITFRKYKNTYLINNNTENVITYKISLKQSYCGCGNPECCEYKELLTNIIQPYTEYSFSLSSEGEYKIETKYLFEPYTILTTFNKYTQLIEYLASKIKILLCENCCTTAKKIFSKKIIVLLNL